MRLAAGWSRERLKNAGLTAACVLGLWILLAVCFDFYYDLNDDTAMKDILSGAYTGTPDGHNIQMLYPLGWAISLCYRICPAVPWYGIFLCGCAFGALGIGLYSVLAAMQGLAPVRRILLSAALTAGMGSLFLYELVMLQYTVVSGLLAAAAMVRLLVGEEIGQRGGIWYHCLTGLLIVLAFCLRTEMLLLLFPFLLLALIFRLGEQRKDAEKKANWKGSGLFLASVLGAMGLCLLLDGVAYGGTDWRQFRRFFDDRTQVYDFYGLPDYERNQSFYTALGLSEADYTLLENYNFAFSENINSDTMGEIAAYSAAHQEKSMPRRMYESLYTYGYRFFHGQELLFDLLGVAGYFFLGKAMLRSKNKRLLGKLLTLFGLRSLLWLFLLYRGRVPERITHPLYLMELAMLGLLFLTDGKGLQWKKYEKSAILSLYAILLLCGALIRVPGVCSAYIQRETVNLQWQTWKDYCRAHPEQFYYLDVYSSVAYSEKLFEETDPAYRNFDLPGGWCAKSPLAAQKRSYMGLQRADEALLSGAAYFVSDHRREERSPAFLQAYYQEQGREITIEETDRCGDFSVYRIR